MKGDYLGEFQEIVLLTIVVLEDNAYGVTIQKEIDSRVGRYISRGSLHTALTRLEEKGLIRSSMGGATQARGGRRKRFYCITDKGKIAIQKTREIREQFWRAIPISFLKLSGQ